MKVKLLRPLKTRNPRFNRLAQQMRLREQKPYPVPQWVESPIGTVIEHADGWQLVVNGDAQPACETSLAKCKAHYAAQGIDYETGLGEAFRQRDRLDRGIHPNHFRAYDAGEMDGYDADGNPTLKGRPVDLPEEQPQEQIVVVIPHEAES